MKKKVSLVVSMMMIISSLFTVTFADDTVAKEMYTAKNISKVNFLNEKYSLDGKGSVIAIIDDGIDPNHKDMVLTNPEDVKISKKDIINFNKGKYHSPKIPYMYAYTGECTDVNDPDSYHGMHVAGIAAANGTEKNLEGIRGVAPESQLLIMDIFNDYGAKNPTSFSKGMENAINDAIKLGADVVNMSLDTNYRSSYVDPYIKRMAQKAEKEGVVLVTSAGNTSYIKRDDPYYYDNNRMGQISKTKEMFSIGAYTNDHVTLNMLNIGDNKISFVGNVEDKDKKIYDGVYVGNTEKELKESSSLKGKVAIVQRSSEVKYGIDVADWLEDKSPEGIIIVPENEEDNFQDLYYASYRKNDYKIFRLALYGKEVKKLKLNKNKEMKIDLTVKDKTMEKIKDGLTSFTAWGPTNNLELKPDIVAPGGHIYSAAKNNKYQILSGTSMASPHASGIVALMCQHLRENNIKFNSPKDKVLFIKNNAMNTTDILIDKEHGNIPFSPRRQGSGMINCEKMIQNTTIVTGEDNRAHVELKDFEELKKEFTIRIENMSDKDKAYSIGDNFGVLTSNDVKDKLNYTRLLKGAKIKILDAFNVKGHVNYNKDILNIGSQSSCSIRIEINLPKDLKRNSIVEGYINLNSKGEYPSLSIPYMGLYGRWDEISNIIAYNAETKELGEKKNYCSVNSTEMKIKSNNGYTNVQVGATTLRDLKHIKIDVLDHNGDLLFNLRNEKYPLKGKEKIRDKDDRQIAFGDSKAWNMTLINPLTGVEKPLEDGRYILEITTTLDYPGARTFVNKVDFVVKGEGSKLEYLSPLETDEIAYRLRFTLDEIDASAKKIKIFVNGQITEYNPLDVFDNGAYTIETVLKKGDNIVKVHVEDEIGNISNLIKVVKVK